METYAVKDINGNEAILPESSVISLLQLWEKKCYREDVCSELKSMCEMQHIDFNKISQQTIDNILDDYTNYRDNDDSWHTAVCNAINDHSDEIDDDTSGAAE